MKRVLGLDYGAKTVGAAATDALGLTVQPVETICRDSEKRLRRTLARIEEICRELDVGEIVVGLPLNMDDSGHDRARRKDVIDQLAAVLILESWLARKEKKHGENQI